MTPPPPWNSPMTRRNFARIATAAACSGSFLRAAQSAKFQLHYVLASALYGMAPVEEILPEIARTGADGIDLWSQPHGNQREEVKETGTEKFAEILHTHGARVDVLTRFDLGPFRLAAEFSVARALGASLIVCGSSGPHGLKGDDLKKAVREFAEKMKPHVALAEEKGIRIAIENHGNALIEQPDAMRWLVDSINSPHVGIALAPYHLSQDPPQLEQLIDDLGDRLLLFYAWDYGMGCTQKLPKEFELLQLPGRGSLDFTPLLRALKKINFTGLTEIFMHPTPRGVPILDTTPEVTAEINRARQYLDEKLALL